MHILNGAWIQFARFPPETTTFFNSIPFRPSESFPSHFLREFNGDRMGLKMGTAWWVLGLSLSWVHEWAALQTHITQYYVFSRKYSTAETIFLFRLQDVYREQPLSSTMSQSTLNILNLISWHVFSPSSQVSWLNELLSNYVGNNESWLYCYYAHIWGYICIVFVQYFSTTYSTV